MDFGSAGGVSTRQSTNTLQQQEQEQQQQQAQFLLQQQLQLKTEYQQPSESQPAFVTPAALTSAPEAPSVISDGFSPSSAHSSQVWQDSPASKTLSSPATSVMSPHSSSVSPLVDPLILSPGQETKPLPAETTESPKKRRGRPRLTETGKPARRAASRVAAAGGGASKTETRAQQKKAAERRRASIASTNGADESKGHDFDDKKSRIRARNREAAHKCRQKKQKGIEELQTQEAMAENVNRTLAAEASELRTEILMLKNMVLQHGACGCSYIDEYITGAAANLAHTGIQATATASALAPVSGQGEFDANGRSGSGGVEGESYVDWKMFDMDPKPSIAALGSESGFSALDDISAHSVRAQSQGPMMI